jgi:hypothetical protein
MKKKHRKALGHYIRWIADEMGLRDWTFDLIIAEPDPPANRDPEGKGVFGATCEPCPGRKQATLTFAPWKRNVPKEELRETVVHELVHCHFFGLWDTMRRDLLQTLGQGEYDIFIAGSERQMEYGVDAVAQALAKQMPLIEWSNTGEEYE